MAQYARPVASQEQPVAPTQQAYVPIPPMQNFIKGRPVVSIDEARASQIDLDGSLYVFPDIGNKKIYTKQINLDGTASFNVFSLDDTPINSSLVTQTASYVTRAELDKIIAELKAKLVPAETPKDKPIFNL